MTTVRTTGGAGAGAGTGAQPGLLLLGQEFDDDALPTTEFTLPPPDPFRSKARALLLDGIV